MNRLILAFQFLTRIPMPAVKSFDARDLSRSAVWFPFVGVVIGACVAAAALLGARIDVWLGALSGLVMWIWITGALHLDGLADLFDALGASHRDPERFLAVLRDPHIGTFGVLALIVVTLSKLILISVAIRAGAPLAVSTMLLAAWARWGTIVWSNTLPALTSGHAERFAWEKSRAAPILWCCALMLASAVLAPALLCAPVVVFAWRHFLSARIGGMTGDCLGAGLEITELTLLFAVVSGAKLGVAGPLTF